MNSASISRPRALAGKLVDVHPILSVGNGHGNPAAFPLLRCESLPPDSQHKSLHPNRAALDNQMNRMDQARTCE